MLALIPLKPEFPNAIVRDDIPIIPYDDIDPEMEPREYKLLVTYGPSNTVLGYDRIIAYAGNVYALKNIPEYWVYAASGFDHSDIYTKNQSMFNRSFQLSNDLEMYEYHTLNNKIANVGLKADDFVWSQEAHGCGPLISAQTILPEPMTHHVVSAAPQIATRQFDEQSPTYPKTIFCVANSPLSYADAVTKFLQSFDIGWMSDPVAVERAWNDPAVLQYEWWGTLYSATGFDLDNEVHQKYMELRPPSTRRILYVLYELLTHCCFESKRVSSRTKIYAEVSCDWVDTVDGDSLEGIMRDEVHEELLEMFKADTSCTYPSLPEASVFINDPRVERTVWKHLRHLRICYMLVNWLKQVWEEFISDMSYDMYYFAEDCDSYEYSEAHIRDTLEEMGAVLDTHGFVVRQDELPLFYYVHTE